ncbi:MAG: hypothetical protein KF723_01945 [Rhizobiaceae bacterium]|nr:hypothetical protein [Rhizobiaceae bacterium]
MVRSLEAQATLPHQAELDEAFAANTAHLSDVEWHGLPVWPLVRMAVMRRLSINRAALFQPAGSLVTGKRMSALPSLMRGMVARRDRSGGESPSALLVATRHFAQRTRPGAQVRAWHPTIEKLAMHLGLDGARRSLRILWPDAFSPADLDGLHTHGLRQTAGRLMVTRALLASTIWSRDRRLRQLVDEILTGAVRARVDLDVGVRASYYVELALVRFWRDQFARMIAEQRLGAIYHQCYYTVIGIGAGLAAADSGIISSDVQHGLGGPNHYAYSWPGALPSASRVFPGEFLVWSRTDAQSIAENVPFDRPVSVVGSNWGSWIEKHPVLAAELAHGRESVSSLRKPGRRLMVYMLARGEPTETFSRIKAILPPGVDVVVRKHPDDVARLDAAGVAEADQLAVSRIWFPTLIQLADGFLGGHSAACLEAAIWPKPTLVFGEKARFLFDGYFGLENLSWAPSPEEGLASWLNGRVAPS